MQTWQALIGTLIGALIGMGTALLTLSLQGKAEHNRWLREQKRRAYSDALKSLARATIVPIGVNIKDIKNWYIILGEVRESLTVLQVYCSQDREYIAKISQELIFTINENDFTSLATTASTIKDIEGDVSGFVLWGVARIIPKIREVLDQITRIAKLDLERLNT
jgi:gas vesicle protein